MRGIKLAGPHLNSSPAARDSSDLSLLKAGSKRPFEALEVLDEEVEGWEVD